MAELWQSELKEAVRSVDELKAYVPLTAQEEAELSAVVRRFPMQVPRSYLRLIDVHDPNDPIRNLVIPAYYELRGGGMLDTSGESDNTRVPGLQHKYRATALVLATSRCAAYCRYCFRKRLNDRSECSADETIRDLEPVVEYIRQHPEISNVLISGGDPLVMANHRLEGLLSAIREVEHVRIIRIGSKVPVFLPTRITSDPGLLEMLSRHTGADKRLYVVTHVDHPRELSDEAMRAIERLLEAGVILVNQAVLLRGVNDNPETLRDLFNRLAEAGVAPYYVFQCRPVTGSLHSRVPLARGYAIVEAAKRGCSGLAKRLRYVMSHYSGKLEIVGVNAEGLDRRVYLKYQQARDPRDEGRVFSRPLPADACWLDDLPADEPAVRSAAAGGYVRSGAL
jgi:lysine 2,3-aminomutase